MISRRSAEAASPWKADRDGTGGPTGTISSGGGDESDETGKEVVSSGCVGGSCKDPSPFDGGEFILEVSASIRETTPSYPVTTRWTKVAVHLATAAENARSSTHPAAGVKRTRPLVHPAAGAKRTRPSVHPVAGGKTERSLNHHNLAREKKANPWPRPI